jgi:hypothetical protein
LNLAQQKAGKGRVPVTVPMIFAADYISETGKFNGTINLVQQDAGVDDYDRFISPEERLRVAMARQ